MRQAKIRIKTCGMTQEQDIACAIDLGVDAIGLIFYSKSARHLSLTRASALLREIPPFVDVVAVLVNPLVSFVNELEAELPIDYLQFHGEESSDFCQQFKTPYIKAVQASSTKDIIAAMDSHPFSRAILVDTPSVAHYGGTGKTFDWGLIPKNLKKPLILAGGLDASNVLAAVKQVSPYAVDVSSGIEVSAGIKDHDKMNRFVNALWGK